MTDTKPPAIFYAPHADDELISMGIDIINHHDAGRRVIVALLSQGGSPWLLNVLNGMVRDNRAGYTHDPEREGYRAFQLADLGVARWKEFLSATRALAPGCMSHSTWGPEGYKVDDIRMFMLQLEEAYPGASHKTMSWSDPHPDHSTAGMALAGLRKEGKVKDARFYVQLDHLAAAEAGGFKPWRAIAEPAGEDRLKLAARSYKAWNPAAGSYAIGDTSVGDLLDAAVARRVNYVHA